MVDSWLAGTREVTGGSTLWDPRSFWKGGEDGEGMPQVFVCA